MELKEVFEQARGDRDIKDLIELDLEKAKCATLDGLPDELAELTIFNASNLGLENLNGLPLMPKLHTLDLSENKLKGESLKVLIEKTPALEQLNLCGNLIETIDDIKILTGVKSLLTLDLYENKVTQVPNYREEVFKLMPSLRYLDGYDANNEEIEVSEADTNAEDGMSDVEDGDDDDVEEIGLSYLDSSKCLDEEDDSEDFQEKPRKRKAEASDDAPQEKQAKE
jgi:acidic leucine-rich nuclear phosphoprotein 32 family protein A/C/D